MADTNQTNGQWGVPLPNSKEFFQVTNASLVEIQCDVQQNDPALISLCITFDRGSGRHNTPDWQQLGQSTGENHIIKHLWVEIVSIGRVSTILSFFRGVSNNRSIHTLKLEIQLVLVLGVGEVFAEMQTFFESNMNFCRLDCTSFMPSRELNGFVRAISVNTSLRHIQLYGVHIVPNVVEAICSRPNLSYLQLEEEFEYGTCDAIYRLLMKQNSNLRVLELDGMLMANTDRVDLLINGLAANALLKSLTLRSQGTTPRGYRAVSSIFRTFELRQMKGTLHTLQVGGTQNDVDWGNVISVLRGLTSLDTLVLDRTEINRDGFLIWGALFSAVLGPSSSLR
jgi:hypothetical protein